MEKEEKILEVAIDTLLSRNESLIKSLAEFVFRLENQSSQLNWPSVLDTFGLISGQLSNFMKVIKNEKTPNLRNRILLPLILSPDRDEDLARLTDNRVQSFNHEMVHYLRTKLEPDVEKSEHQLMVRASQIAPETSQKQLATVNKIASQIIDIINNSRENWESESGRRSNAPPTFNVQDTHTLIAAISNGTGLKPSSPSSSKPQGLPIQPQTQQQTGPRPPGASKAPSTIKTNIKSASSATPYSR